MNRYSEMVLIVSGIFLSVVFLLNGSGVIDQTIAAQQLIEHGAPAAMVPFAMMCARGVR